MMTSTAIIIWHQKEIFLNGSSNKFYKFFLLKEYDKA